MQASTACVLATAAAPPGPRVAAALELLEGYIRDAHYIAEKQLLVMTGREPRREGDPFLEMIRSGC